MRVYVVRHGESRTNQKGLWTGWLDEPLTDKGRADAEKAARFLSGIHFDKVYASDLQRASETARIATKDALFDTGIELTPILREINVGDIAGKPLKSLTDADRESIKKDGYGIFGGETNAEFRARLDKFNKELEDSDMETVAVFTHAGWLRYFFDAVIGFRHDRNSVACNNCTIAIFEYKNSCWRMHSWINLD